MAATEIPNLGKGFDEASRPYGILQEILSGSFRESGSTRDLGFRVYRVPRDCTTPSLRNKPERFRLAPGSGKQPFRGLLGGSWVIIGGVTSPLIWVISIVTLRITLLITTHEPPSRVEESGLRVQCPDSDTSSMSGLLLKSPNTPGDPHRSAKPQVGWGLSSGGAFQAQEVPEVLGLRICFGFRV